MRYTARAANKIILLCVSTKDWMVLWDGGEESAKGKRIFFFFVFLSKAQKQIKVRTDGTKEKRRSNEK